jgi:WD40 repeat protein
MGYADLGYVVRALCLLDDESFVGYAGDAVVVITLSKFGRILANKMSLGAAVRSLSRLTTATTTRVVAMTESGRFFQLHPHGAEPYGLGPLPFALNKYSLVSVGCSFGVVAAATSSGLAVWNVANGLSTSSLPLESICTLALGQSSPVLAVAIDACITLFHVNPLKRVADCASLHQGRVVNLAFSPDEAQILSAALDNTVILWCVDDGSALWRASAHRSSSFPFAIAFVSSDVVLSGGDDRCTYHVAVSDSSGP